MQMQIPTYRLDADESLEVDLFNDELDFVIRHTLLKKGENGSHYYLLGDGFYRTHNPDTGDTRWFHVRCGKIDKVTLDKSEMLNYIQGTRMKVVAILNGASLIR